MAIQLKLYWGKLDLKSKDYQSHHKVIGESRMSIFNLSISENELLEKMKRFQSTLEK